MSSPSVIVCLSASDAWYGKAIRKLTHSNVNHAFIAYKSSQWGGYWAVQIDNRGVIKIPAEKVENSYLECYDFGIPMENAMRRTRDMYGDKYDWFGIAGFMVKLAAWRTLGRKVKNPLQREGDLFCSEFVARFLQAVDGMYPQIKSLTPSSVAPGGDPAFLGTPSLQSEMSNIDGIERIECPWRNNG